MTKHLRPWRFFKPDTTRIYGVLGLLLLSTSLNALKPWPVALLIDNILGQKPWPKWLETFPQRYPVSTQIALIALLLFCTYLLQGGLSAIQNYFSIKIGLRGLRRVRNEIFSVLQRLSLKFHHNARSGDLIYRAAWDTFSFQTLFQQGFMTTTSALLSLVLMVAVMSQLNFSLTLIAVATVPALMAVIRFFGKKMTEQGSVAQQAESLVTSHVQQSMSALPLIQSYTREFFERRRFRLFTAKAQHERLTQHGWELVYWFAISVVFGLGTAAIILMGSRQVLAGKLTVGELWIFLSYLSQLYEPLNQLSHVGATVSSATAGTKRVFEILDTEEDVKESPNPRAVVRAGKEHSIKTAPGSQPPVVTKGNIEIENIHFGYQAGREVLKGISFKLRAGESAALIGPSGVGKSTLMNLLPRFYDPTQGSVKLEGVDLRELKLRDLRSQIAVVLQEPIIMTGSVAENISYGNPHASKTEIEQAAEQASALGFIKKMAQGFETIVGDGAIRLSVGERQRINLARAFLKNAPILLLDEPTSALDTESEAQVVASLHRLMEGRTTLMVAHRLTTIRRVTKIIVLQDGKIAESGNHDQLLEIGGYYSRVASGQLQLE
jgi:ATP-binding cassette subfamily B protein/subfamily B ATP-binding cassette protein MsbA